VESLQSLDTFQKELIFSLLSLSRDAGMQIIKNEYLSDTRLIEKKEDIFAEYISKVSEKKS